MGKHNKKVHAVQIIWDDAKGTAGWDNIAEFDQPLQVVTVGYLVTNTKHSVIIASSCTQQGVFGGLTRIPNGMIISITKLL